MYKYDAIEDEEDDTETVQTPRDTITERAAAAAKGRKLALASRLSHADSIDDEEDDDEDSGDDDDDEDDNEDGEDDDEGTSLDYVHLDSLMNVLGLTNKWEETVPRRFVAAVFISAHRYVS
jgi:hypothetical protein